VPPRLVGGSAGPHYVTPRGCWRFSTILQKLARPAPQGSFREPFGQPADRKVVRRILATPSAYQVAESAYSVGTIGVDLRSSEHLRVARSMHARTLMSSPLQLQHRIRRFVVSLQSQSSRGAARERRIREALVKSARETGVGYRDACASATPEDFIRRISLVVRTAKKSKAALLSLLDLEYMHIADCRDLMFEARAIENILTAARDAAKRRQRRRNASAKDRVSRSRRALGTPA
jgi:hypothetical protein